MDSIFPNKTSSHEIYDVLKGDYPKLSLAKDVIPGKEVSDTLIDIPSVMKQSGKLSVYVSLNETMDDLVKYLGWSKADVSTVFVKEIALEHILNCSLRIGGMDIVRLDRHQIKEFCDRYMMPEGDVYVELFSKFIEQIPVNSCCYHTVNVCFEYEKYDTESYSVERRVFKYENYDAAYESDIGYNEDAFEMEYYTTYQGLTPDMKILRLKEENRKDMISFLDKGTNIREPSDLSLAKYIFFDAKQYTDPSNRLAKRLKTSGVQVFNDDIAHTIGEQELIDLPIANQYMWALPQNSQQEFVRVDGKVLATSLPIAYALRANKVRVAQGMAGAYFSH
jgi:hypothetical protein